MLTHSQEKQPLIRSPLIPRNKSDPSQSARPVCRMFRDIENRYYQIKLALKKLFNERMTGKDSALNAQASHSVHECTIYRVNARAYIYDMTAAQLADLLERVQEILDDYLLDGGSNNLWVQEYVAAEYQRGTTAAYTNLAVQSPVYASQTTLSSLLSSPAYQNQIAAAYVATYSEWKGISDKARADLANVISDAIGRGINPRETARVISSRLDVSMAAAKNIAQTEQVGALRQAQWLETDWARERLGINTALLHLSALKPTTRTSHAFWHGKTRTVNEVSEWYSRDGNRFRCYCSQIPVILDKNGAVVNTGLVERLTQERRQWSPDN